MTSAKINSKNWFKFLIGLFVSVFIIAVFFLCIRKIGESIQINQGNSLNRKSLGQTKSLEGSETFYRIDNKENDNLYSENKKKIEDEMRSNKCRIVPPVLMKQIDPEYPKEAQKKGIQGKVIFEAEIDAKGRIRSARLLKSFHPIFVTPSLKAIRQWIYRPMLLNDEPCKCLATITCVFRLTKTRKKIPVLVWTGII